MKAILYCADQDILKNIMTGAVGGIPSVWLESRMGLRDRSLRQSEFGCVCSCKRERE